MSKKLPEITVGEWLEAQRLISDCRFGEKPVGSMTVEEYAGLTKLSRSQSNKQLREMTARGLATKQRWGRGGCGGTQNVYILKPKKEWPKK